MNKIDMDISRIRRISDNLLSTHDSLVLSNKNAKLTADLKQDAYYLKQLIGDIPPNVELVKKVYSLTSNDCYGIVGEYTGYSNYLCSDVPFGTPVPLEYIDSYIADLNVELQLKHYGGNQ